MYFGYGYGNVNIYDWRRLKHFSINNFINKMIKDSLIILKYSPMWLPLFSIHLWNTRMWELWELLLVIYCYENISIGTMLIVNLLTVCGNNFKMLWQDLGDCVLSRIRAPHIFTHFSCYFVQSRTYFTF